MEVSRDYGHPEDNDPSTTYIVWEKVPDGQPATAPVVSDSFGLNDVFGAATQRTNARPVTLQLDIDSLTVCSIDPSEPSFVDHEVKRYQDKDAPF